MTHSHSASEALITDDRKMLEGWFRNRPSSESVAGFVPGPGIAKLKLKFDPGLMKDALALCLERRSYEGDMMDKGFAAIALTRRPGQTRMSANDLSGRYWLRRSDDYTEEPREDFVDEAAFSELDPEFADTYFAHIHEELSKRVKIGRMRILSKPVYNCNSWHRYPEPRLHIPILSNPGSLFIVNHHVTHLPADGSVYFTDTRGYHTALNGGEDSRVHIVAALPDGLVVD